HRSPSWQGFLAHDKNFADLTGAPDRLLQPVRFKRQAVFLHPLYCPVQVLDDLLCAHDPNYFSSPVSISGKLASSEGSHDQVTLFCHSMNASQNIFGRRTEAAHIEELSLMVHACHLLAN